MCTRRLDLALCFIGDLFFVTVGCVLRDIQAVPNLTRRSILLKNFNLTILSFVFYLKVILSMSEIIPLMTRVLVTFGANTAAASSHVRRKNGKFNSGKNSKKRQE